MRKTDATCVLVLFLATVGVYFPALFQGKVLLPADIVPLMAPWAATAREKFPDYRFAQNQLHGPIFEYYSWRHYARERMRAGEVPLWNPYELSGNVLLANSQSAVLYPPNLLLYVLPLWYGINLVTAFHTFLTGLLMYLLLRSLNLRPVAAVTGALVWMFCGLQVVWTEFQTPTAALCWLPGILWAWERYRQGGGLRWAILGSGSGIAMALLAGHLHFCFYVILAFFLFAIWRTVDDRRLANDDRSQDKKLEGLGQAGWRISHQESGTMVHRPTSIVNLGVLVGTIAFGILLASATILPVLEMGRMNFRAEKSGYESAIALRMPPANLLALLIPDLFGNPRDYVEFDKSGAPSVGHPYWGSTPPPVRPGDKLPAVGFDFIEFTGYLGIPALILALTALIAPIIRHFDRTKGAPTVDTPAHLYPHTFTRSYFPVLALIGLLLALGTPLCATLFYGVPGYRQFNATGRALCLFSFAGSALAAYGVQLVMDDRRRQFSSLAAAIASMIVIVAGLIVFPGMGLSWSTLFTDAWFGYEIANLERFLLFAILALTAIWAARLRGRSARQGEKGISRSLQDDVDRDHDAGGVRIGSVFRVGFVWLLPAICAADLLSWSHGFNPMTDPAMLGYPTETTTYLQRAGSARTVSLETPGKGIKSFIVPNYNVVDHLREVQGADSLHTKRYHKFMEKVLASIDPANSHFADPNTIRLPSVKHAIVDLLNVRYVATQQPLAEYSKVADVEMSIYENPRAAGPAWMVGQAERVGDLDSAFIRLGDPTFDGKKIALVEQDPGGLDPAATGSPVRQTEFSVHRLTFEIDARANGLLVVSEPYFPGWRAEIDSNPAPIIAADYILRAVPIPAGKHTVKMRYEPASFRLGLYLTLTSISFLVAIVTVRKRGL